MCPVPETVSPLCVLCFLGPIFRWLSSPAPVILLCLSSMDRTAFLVSIFHVLTPPLSSSPVPSSPPVSPTSFSVLPSPRFLPSCLPSSSSLLAPSASPPPHLPPFPPPCCPPSLSFFPGPLTAFHPVSPLSFPISPSPLLALLPFLSSSFPALPLCPTPPLYSSNSLPSRFTCRPRHRSSCKNCLRNPYPLLSFLGHFRNDIPPPTTPSK